MTTMHVVPKTLDLLTIQRTNDTDLYPYCGEQLETEDLLLQDGLITKIPLYMGGITLRAYGFTITPRVGIC